VNEAWTDISVDSGLVMVYGPRLGRLYLLPVESAHDTTFLRVAGIRARGRLHHLEDPVDRIVHDRASLNGRPVPHAAFELRLLHLLVRCLRYVQSFRTTARALQFLARLRRSRAITREASKSEIGRMVSAVEAAAGAGDCYARSLLTAYLCLCAGLRCTLLIGVLAPTRKMHAWCCTDRELPFEPAPEHYMYQPLWSLQLAP
jgi:hypothetical protein